MIDPFERQIGKTETRKVLKEYQEKLIDEFRKVLGVIEGDRWWATGHGRPRDPEEIDWDIYRLILRNYVNTVLSAPKALVMQQHIEALISVDSEDFDSAITELYTHFVSFLNR